MLPKVELYLLDFAVKALPFSFSVSITLDFATSFSEIEPTIFFTSAGGLKAYSLVTSQVKTIGSLGNFAYGVAYDPNGDKIYWSDNLVAWTYGWDTAKYAIFRANRDGTELETVLDTKECKHGTSYVFLAVSVANSPQFLQMVCQRRWTLTG